MYFTTLFVPVPPLTEEAWFPMTYGAGRTLHFSLYTASKRIVFQSNDISKPPTISLNMPPSSGAKVAR